jgi:hypothetical protein
MKGYQRKRRVGYCTECSWQGNSDDQPDIQWGLAMDCPVCKGLARSHIEVKCCGHWMDSSGFTNTCEHCDSDYNWAGDLLADRSQWGEETGEHISDILGIQ